jgi:fructose-1,6-bisphosphatase II / sedoheptulose-1,7-bisphosphatase
MGSGGAPESVLAAAALKCLGRQICGQLLLLNDDERICARRAGITDIDCNYTRDEPVTKDVIVAATGATQGAIPAGIKQEPGWITTKTLLMRSKTGSMRRRQYRSLVR